MKFIIDYLKFWILISSVLGFIFGPLALGLHLDTVYNGGGTAIVVGGFITVINAFYLFHKADST